MVTAFNGRANFDQFVAEDVIEETGHGTRSLLDDGFVGEARWRTDIQLVLLDLYFVDDAAQLNFVFLVDWTANDARVVQV